MWDSLKDTLNDVVPPAESEKNPCSEADDTGSTWHHLRRVAAAAADAASAATAGAEVVAFVGTRGRGGKGGGGGADLG